nr:methyltransferase domain-containing protein [Pseudomonas indica]
MGVNTGAKATGEVASSGGKPTVELFGGQKAQTPGAINVDIRPDIQSGIRADATKLPFRDNSLGEVVASNPFIPKSAGGTNSMMDFLPEATRVVEPGGKIFINANAANPYGKIPSASELESLGLRVIQNGPLDSRFSGQTFLRTDGSVITNLDSMRTIVLEKFK